jgi:hypothetical protein
MLVSPFDISGKSAADWHRHVNNKARAGDAAAGFFIFDDAYCRCGFELANGVSDIFAKI